MKYAKVPKANAENAKRLLSGLGAFDASRDVKHSRSYVYFPVLDIDAKAKKLIYKAGIGIVDARGRKSEARIDYNDRLGRILKRSEMDYIARGYELLGNIAVIEISEKLKGKEKDIAQAVLDSNPSVKTVLAKAGAVSGPYRTRRFRYIKGIRSYIATYHENGSTFRFDVRKVFFSGKLAYERSRVSSLVHDGERVVVVGAGVGPFVVEIAKTHPSAEVIGIELNRHAYGYMLENIRLNKAPNAKAVLGDAGKIYKDYRGYADRIVIPMPTTSPEFLDQIIAMARKSATVHMYMFVGNDDADSEGAWEKIKEHAKKNKYKVRLLGRRVVRPYSAREVESVIDFRISKMQ